MESRLGAFEENIDFIDEMNKKANGVVNFAVNWTADLPAAALNKIHGLKPPADAKKDTRTGFLGGRRM